MMSNRSLNRVITLGALFLIAVPQTFCQSVSIFADTSLGQIKFAVSDIQAALTKKGQASQVFPLAGLGSAGAGDKIAIGLTSNNTFTGLVGAQGGAIPAGIGEQAYALKTTTQGQKIFWVIGGDANGAMYGGIQIAENILFEGMAGSYDVKESPAILRRGIKLNLPLDQVAETYGTSKTTAKANAIPNVWDMSFWTAWFDEMARNRYNVLSVWSNHPFTSFINIEADYNGVAIQGVKGLDGKVINTMSIDEKIVFWKKVMAYAKSRGFYFYIFNWNVWTDNATGKYGITESVTNPATIKYMRKCMSTLWETYPDLDGFGITEGEHMSGTDADGLFLANTYGLGTVDYIKNNPTKKVKFIHRWHMADFTTIKNNFSELFKYPNNISFEMSFKYSLAHMYSAAEPQRMDQKTEIDPLVAAGLKTNFTVRNDDYYHHNWGDPDFARAYINGMIKKGDWFAGFYIGSDGFSQTKTFFSKDPKIKETLHIQHQWYMFKLWGRLSYNPTTSDNVFKNILATKYPGVSSDGLFTAWKKASRSLPTVGDLITGSLGRDDQWYPEACQSDQNAGDPSPFLTIGEFALANPSKGSALASIAVTASGNLGGKKSSYVVADEIEADAKDALAFASTLNPSANSELATATMHIKAMSLLSNYYAYKIRGATFNKAGKKPEATGAMGKAYCWWMLYANLMDANYIGQTMARTYDIANWHVHDGSVLTEYQDLLGNKSTPSCADVSGTFQPKFQLKNQIGIRSLRNRGIIFDMPNAGAVSISIFNSFGKRVLEQAYNAKLGANELKFSKSLGMGLHFVQIKSANASTKGTLQLTAFE